MTLNGNQATHSAPESFKTPGIRLHHQGLRDCDSTVECEQANLKSTPVRPSTHHRSCGNKQGFGWGQGSAPFTGSQATPIAESAQWARSETSNQICRQPQRGETQSKRAGAFPEVSIRAARHHGTREPHGQSEPAQLQA